jgi:transaldolase
MQRSLTGFAQEARRMTPLQSLVATGTKLWLDSVDPDEIARNRAFGATGATSNPIIIADLVRTGRFDDDIRAFAEDGLDDEAVAWAMTDKLVGAAQKVFLPVWEETEGDDGWVSFELDPLIEDPDRRLPADEKARLYVELGKRWGSGADDTNRMIKVPATDGGLLALEDLVAAGLCVNVTLIFSERQYVAARDACWRGIRRLADRSKVKTVYSIFVSRVDVYTKKELPRLSPAAQGQVGIVNAKRIRELNRDFWADKGLPLKQEMVFASTGTKDKADPPWKYVEAFAGSDIETNPPATNEAVEASGRTFTRRVDEWPPAAVLEEITREVKQGDLEAALMREGVDKFAGPHKKLLALIAEKRASLIAAG